jgi:hypothetical protein
MESYELFWINKVLPDHNLKKWFRFENFSFDTQKDTSKLLTLILL